MGMNCSSPSDPASQHSKRLDLELAKAQKNMKDEIKMLLLGPGESGKSTLFKQMKILARAGGYSEAELQRYKATIYNNCVSQMLLLCENAEGVVFENPENNANRQQILQLGSVNDSWTPELCDMIKALWVDKGIQDLFATSEMVALLNESASYFFNNLDRFRDPDGYTPTKQDVLRARVRSTGIEEAEFKFDELNFRMLDVGGQRSERRKWIHCLADDHQVLTSRGFLFLDEMRCVLQPIASSTIIHEPPLLVMGYDPLSQQVVLEHPIDLVVNEAGKQQLVCFAEKCSGDDSAATGVNLCCTLQHDMYVSVSQPPSFQKVKAEALLRDCNDRDAGRVPLTMLGSAPCGLRERKPAPPQDRDFVRALDLAEGSALHVFLKMLGHLVSVRCEAECQCQGRGSGDGCALLLVTQQSAYVAAQLTELAVRHLLFDGAVKILDVDWQRYWHSLHVGAIGPAGGLNVRCVYQQLSTDELRAVVSGLVEAHCMGGKGECSAVSGVLVASSPNERDEWVQMLFLAGFVCKVGRDCSGERWLLHYREGSFVDVANVHAVPYEGTTWCLTMPSGFIVARRAVRDAGVVVAASTPVVVGNCFDAVTVVLFCASLSEYDQNLREDRSTNRMHESLELFDEIVNSPWFRKPPVVLFLNKTDLFKEKITRVPLTCCFQNYTGSQEPKEAMEYIRSRFEELPQDRSKVLYVHFTCAVSTENVEVVFRVVKETLLKEIIYNFAL